MSKLIYLKNFRNYFNRKIKYLAESTDYPLDRVSFSDKNFNPNDGVKGNDIVNWCYEDADRTIHTYDWTPDYVLVTHSERRGTLDVDVIDSRWFVTEFVRTRASQYQVSLQRDIIADDLTNLLDAPIYIEKGLITDKTNPLLYNKENLVFNQIKTSEVLIKDRSNVAWIVGYIASNYDGIQSVLFNDNAGTGTFMNQYAEGSIYFNSDININDVSFVYRGTTIQGTQQPIPETLTNNQMAWLYVPLYKRLDYKVRIQNASNNSTGTIQLHYRESDTVVSENYSMLINGKSTRNHLVDAPYDMFAIPYGKINVIGDGGEYVTSQEAALEIAMEIAKDIGKDNVYDIQLLPYCPVQSVLAVNSENYLDLSSSIVGQDYSRVYNSAGTQKESVCLWCKQSKTSITLSKYNLKVNRPTHTEYGQTVYDNPEYIDYKVSNECDMYRLVSPNYNGQFELSLAKNGGQIGNIIVDINYKPFSPYIHVQPEFKFLYNGSNGQFGDCRGLICGGDFSLPVLSDAWTDYQVQNKNYQAIFDRQIQNMDVNNSLRNSRDTFNAVVGSAAGIGMGAIKGAQSGGVGGAIMGGVSGGVISGLISANSIRSNKELQAETRSYAIDNYNMQLGNVQALPYSLTKVDAFNNNNKIFPFIEIYSCTQTEKDAFISKLKYDGMTVGIISTIRDFIPAEGEAYIKGQLIRYEATSEDTHMLNSIYDELNKGVFITL